MIVHRLRLQNIRSYADQTGDFPEGTILIHGENGAGKTSLLMGLFGGLFLSEIWNVGTNSFNLEEFVRRGETKGVVELVFDVIGAEYTVEWELYTTSTPNSATLTSTALYEQVSGSAMFTGKYSAFSGWTKTISPTLYTSSKARSTASSRPTIERG